MLLGSRLRIIHHVLVLADFCLYYLRILCVCVCVYTLSHVWLCDRKDCSPPGSSVLAISQTRILEWVAISYSKASSWPRYWTCLFCIAGRFFYPLSRQGEAWYTVYALLTQFLRVFSWTYYRIRTIWDYFKWPWFKLPIAKIINYPGLSGKCFFVCFVLTWFTVCVSFWCTAKWFSYTYINVYSLSSSFHYSLL